MHLKLQHQQRKCWLLLLHGSLSALSIPGYGMNWCNILRRLVGIESRGPPQPSFICRKTQLASLFALHRLLHALRKFVEPLESPLMNRAEFQRL